MEYLGESKSHCKTDSNRLAQRAEMLAFQQACKFMRKDGT